MTIYYRVQPYITETSPPIGEGKLEALALLAAETFTYRQAPEAAKAACERHNMPFEVIKVFETCEGVYRPPAILAKGTYDGD